MPIQYKFLLWYYNRFLRFDFSNMSAAQMRHKVEVETGRVKKWLNGPLARVHHVEDCLIPGRGGDIPIRIYYPDERKGRPVITYYHGGGFVIYGLDSHDHVCRRLCRDNGAVVVSVDYRLAPEHKFPAAVEDAFDALVWVEQNVEALGGDVARLVVLGDSAGGNLAAVVSQLARDRGGPELAAQVLVYPVVDARMQHPSVKENAEGYILTEKLMHWFLDKYKNTDDDLTNPLLSPLLADDLSGLPPALVLVAQYDPLRDEGIEYAQKLRAEGTPARYIHYKGLTHSFFSMPGLSKQCAIAYEDVRDFLTECLRTR